MTSDDHQEDTSLSESETTSLSQDVSSNLNDPGEEALAHATEPALVEKRIWIEMIAAIGVAVTVSAFIGPYTFVLGVGLGGVLALLNHKWLSSSLRRVLMSENQKAPSAAVFKFIIRWVVIGFLAFLANRTGYFDGTGIILGLFVTALAVMVEAAYLGYKAIGR
jgi:hypothetical protein